ncbi:uncharacterized protein LOC126907012 isoform X2 [Daktulosphaira vitifoliae]|uniref:uncharacterized protein LOC126907012 isoform X2 n=1 Tax=Daktulosphaira vitifoliae TaxID=58002 RepID=UPI0021AA3B9E|nr:uncharacterized protein LOC126907012 isoform X2 [Daktulosphaira vitifoliae]
MFIKDHGNSDAASIVEALAGDGEGHLVPTPVRREKIKASKRELALEADKVLEQANSVASLHSAAPPRGQQRNKHGGSSLQRKNSFGGTDSKKWNSEGKLSSYRSLDRPNNRPNKQNNKQEENDELLSPNDTMRQRKSTSTRLKRSVSDAGDLKKTSTNKDQDKNSISLFGTIERIKKKINNNNTKNSGNTTDRTMRMTEPPPPPPPVRAKKQLSPIIESSPREEYFKYSNDPFNDTPPPSRPVRRGHNVDRIVRRLLGEPPRPPPTLNRPEPVASYVQHNGNEPFSYTATSPTVINIPDTTRDDGHQYRTTNDMDDTWMSYEDLSHRRDALESRLQKRAASSSTIRPSVVPATPDTYATVYKKNETLGGGDRYFERKIVTEHRFARRTPRLDDDVVDRPTRVISSGRPTVVSRNNVPVINGPSSLSVNNSGGNYQTGKPAKKRSKLDKFKMLFTRSSKENKRPSSSKVSNSDPESYTSSSLRKRYNVYTGDDGHYSTKQKRLPSPSKHSGKFGNNSWFKSLDRFDKKTKRPKTFTSGSENDEEIRVHRINDRNKGWVPPRSYHSVGNLNSMDIDHSPTRHMTEKRHSLIDSSADSTTEGDSSQKSHKSTVYLHATTVGEIPESRQLHQSVFGSKSKKAASREELSTQNDAFVGTQKRTLSRSVSVLAPWAPRHHDEREIEYDENGRPPRAPKKWPIKATKSDPEEVIRPPIRQNRSSKSSGEDSSLMDEVIIRTTSRTGELVKDGRSGRTLGRSVSSANKYAPNIIYRSRTKS